jgi:hypothetical protein
MTSAPSRPEVEILLDSRSEVRADKTEKELIPFRFPQLFVPAKREMLSRAVLAS